MGKREFELKVVIVGLALLGKISKYDTLIESLEGLKEWLEKEENEKFKLEGLKIRLKKVYEDLFVARKLLVNLERLYGIKI